MQGYKYKVYLVDDEPIAIELMTNIIQNFCPEIDLIGTADNAVKCLEEIGENIPDILISDIQMPGQSGIDLIRLVRERYPDVVNVIISGYQEFEYAKAAMKLDVEEYLLKPIVPVEFCKSLELIERKVDGLFQQKRKVFLSENEQMTNFHLERYFPDKLYYAVIIRKNGLPKRFIGKDQEIQVFDYQNIIMNGRDIMETMYLIPERLVEGNKVLPLLENAYQRETQNASYVTMALTKYPFESVQMQEKIKQLYRCLDFGLVIGVNQILYFDDKKRENLMTYNYRPVLKKLEKYLEENRINRAQEEMKAMGEYFISEKIPQKELEKIINIIILILKENVKEFKWDVEAEIGLEDVLYNTGDMNEVFHELASFLDKLTENMNANKMDSPEFIQSIIAYLEKHLTDDISMKNIAKVFGISQTYLGQLFHKYKNVPFSNYVIEMRIQRAKELMKSDNSMLIKDVAQLVGYQDQFYFSRIFRNMTGISPSEYIAKAID